MKFCKCILLFRNYLFNEAAFLFMISAFLELAVLLSSFSRHLLHQSNLMTKKVRKIQYSPNSLTFLFGIQEFTKICYFEISQILI